MLCAQRRIEHRERRDNRSPNWTWHTHATHAIARGAELTTVRDNLRHASIATTSISRQGNPGSLINSVFSVSRTSLQSHEFRFPA